jgi:pimeloyl-ACP methyl ester carboxylesterase
MDLSTWQNKGQFITINGHRQFYLDSGGSLPVMVILHGYPTCSLDYHKVWPLLTRHHRVVVHDHLGFGLSDKPLKYAYSLIEQADQALQLWQTLGICKATVLAHDYGTSVATELIARDNRGLLPGLGIEQLILCNGSMHIELSKLRLIQKLLLNRVTGPLIARLTSQRVFNRNMRQLFVDSGRLDQQEVDLMWQLLIHNNGRAVLHRITGYIRERRQFWHRWIGALQQTEIPVKLIWAMNDPVAVAPMATVLHEEISNSQLIKLEGLGHFPMLEDPERWSRAVLS